MDIVGVIPKISMIKLSIIKTNELLGLKVEEQGKEETFINGNIRFDKISYTYDDYNIVLDRVSFIINKGEKIIIKGKSGIGKSTLLQILNKNIKGYKGNVYINEINIKDYSLITIKNNIRYISQRERLFTGTIRDNILLDGDYSINDLNEVIKITRIDSLLDKKSLRLNSLLIDGGSNLSGGERQRIVLARSIIDKPPILILDEALSEVDKDLEEDIVKNLIDYLKESTIIYITHHNILKGFNILDLEAKTRNGEVLC